jgi:5-methylcytosine-specific restriction protein B
MARRADALQALVDAIRGGLGTAPNDVLKGQMHALFGERYAARVGQEPTLLRNAYALANDDDGGGVPYAGFINPENPPNGPYGGTSLVWFPTKGAGTLIGFGVGTRGLSPDEGVLTRPGHRRRIAALRKRLAALGVEAWSKPDPAGLGFKVPETVQRRFPGFEAVFKRYGAEMYCNALVPRDDAEKARAVVAAFLDLYAYERAWPVLKSAEPEYEALLAELRGSLFAAPTTTEVDALLRARRFVVLQGPPGTGKTRLAGEVMKEFFHGRGMTIQFHPAVTYEDFVVGLSPNEASGTLQFRVRRGSLLEAIAQAKEMPFVLVIDEVNRADLGKVLGEAIYLFEAGEVGHRRVRLPHATDGMTELVLPENLYVLGTMNTADRSIASMDLAVRRRFAFLNMPPDRSVVERYSPETGLRFFDRLVNVFVEHAPDDALDLIPGHAYFLAKTDVELATRVKTELLPLLQEYLHQGFLGAASAELSAVRDELEDWVRETDVRRPA